MRLTEKQNPEKRAILLPLVTEKISDVEYIKDDNAIAFSYDAAEAASHLPKNVSEDIFVLIQFVDDDAISASAVLNLSLGSPKWNRNQLSIFDTKTEYAIALTPAEQNRLLTCLLQTIAKNT